VFPAFTEKCSINITLLSDQYNRVPHVYWMGTALCEV